MELLTAVADTSRLSILQALTTGPRCVCELQEQVPIPANLLSYHLKVLREAGLIRGSRRGRWIDYCLAEDAAARLHATLPLPCPQAAGGTDGEARGPAARSASTCRGDASAAVGTGVRS